MIQKPSGDVKMQLNKKGFIFLCCLVYFTSYMTRINYGATIAEIIAATGVTKAYAGIAVTGAFITYGIGQLISGYIGDVISPRYLITWGLGATSLMNVAVGICDNMTVVIILWCINGFAQSFLWPPLVRCMTSELTVNDFKKACSLVTVASAVATILIYLIVPLIITIHNWHGVFTFCGLLGIAVSAIWFFTTKSLTANRNEVGKETHPDDQKGAGSAFKIIVSMGVLPILAVIMLQGMLRDGITTWMPSYITDAFALSPASSILITVVIPAFTIVSILLSRKFDKVNKTELHTAFWLWVMCLASSFGLLLFFKTQMLVSAILMAFMTATMHGTNLMLIGNLPVRFIKYGRASLFSGILNSCTYVGSAVSAYGIAFLSTHYGWHMTIAVWAGIALLGAVLSAISIKMTRKLFM